MASFSRFGNDLYTGKRSYNIVGSRRIWWIFSGVLLLVVIVGTVLHGGFAFGIEFRGGSQFQISDTTNLNQTFAGNT
ncbi:MAG: protein translocase subunit SecF, partial [Actinomycetota bacterium]